MQTLKRRNKKTSAVVYRRAFKTLIAKEVEDIRKRIKDPDHNSEIKNDFAKRVIALAEQDE